MTDRKVAELLIEQEGNCCKPVLIRCKSCFLLNDAGTHCTILGPCTRANHDVVKAAKAKLEELDGK